MIEMLCDELSKRSGLLYIRIWITWIH
jgi:hypothetical protein